LGGRKNREISILLSSSFSEKKKRGLKTNSCHFSLPKAGKSLSIGSRGGKRGVVRIDREGRGGGGLCSWKERPRGKKKGWQGFGGDVFILDWGGKEKELKKLFGGGSNKIHSQRKWGSTSGEVSSYFSSEALRRRKTCFQRGRIPYKERGGGGGESSEGGGRDIFHHLLLLRVHKNNRLENLREEERSFFRGGEGEIAKKDEDGGGRGYLFSRNRGRRGSFCLEEEKKGVNIPLGIRGASKY